VGRLRQLSGQGCPRGLSGICFLSALPSKGAIAISTPPTISVPCQDDSAGRVFLEG
jgi:hypothetical protein